jgi:hypothetical protein
MEFKLKGIQVKIELISIQNQVEIALKMCRKQVEKISRYRVEIETIRDLYV